MKLRKLLPAAMLMAAGLPALAGSTQGQDHPWGWLPPNVNSGYGQVVDHLYLTIMWIVAIAFFLTEGALIAFMIAFRARPGRRATYFHGSTAAELTWTVIPCAILVWIAVTQYEAWKDIRERIPKDADACVVQVLANQFNWHFRHADKAGKFGTEESNLLTSSDQLHVPLNTKVVCKMTSKDVIHSFFLPMARVKQDVVPGMLTRIWFEIDRVPVWKVTRHEKRQLKDPVTGKVVPTDVLLGELVPLTEGEFNKVRVAMPSVWALDPDGKSGSWQPRLRWEHSTPDDTGQRENYYAIGAQKTLYRVNGKFAEGDPKDAQYVFHYYEIACAELCGLGHTGMRGQLYVEPADMYASWMAEKAIYGPTTEASKFVDLWDGVYSKEAWYIRGIR